MYMSAGDVVSMIPSHLPMDQFFAGWKAAQVAEAGRWGQWGIFRDPQLALPALAVVLSAVITRAKNNLPINSVQDIVDKAKKALQRSKKLTPGIFVRHVFGIAWSEYKPFTRELPKPQMMIFDLHGVNAQVVSELAGYLKDHEGAVGIIINEGDQESLSRFDGALVIPWRENLDTNAVEAQVIDWAKEQKIVNPDIMLVSADKRFTANDNVFVVHVGRTADGQLELAFATMSGLADQVAFLGLGRMENNVIKFTMPKIGTDDAGRWYADMQTFATQL
jgi:hypothetical protein